MRRPKPTDVCLQLFVKNFNITFYLFIYFYKPLIVPFIPIFRKIQWRSGYQDGVLELSSPEEKIVRSIALICLLEFLHSTYKNICFLKLSLMFQECRPLRTLILSRKMLGQIGEQYGVIYLLNFSRHKPQGFLKI